MVSTLKTKAAEEISKLFLLIAKIEISGNEILKPCILSLGIEPMALSLFF